MVRHYFICTCGKKCRVVEKEIREHLFTKEHHDNTFRITKEQALQKLQKKMSKLFDNMTNMSDNEFIEKSNKYKRQFEKLKVDEKPDNEILWIHRIKIWSVHITCYVNHRMQDEYKLEILSNVEY